VFSGELMDSGFPDLRDPAVAIDVMKGDLGSDSGRGQSIYEVNQEMVDQGRLKRVARENMRPGDVITLDDGTKVSFDGVQRWVYLQVSHDPAQGWVLGFAVLVVLGLGVSLVIKRRRLWVRAVPGGTGGSVLLLGGLARTDQAGYGEEFGRVTEDLLAELTPSPAKEDAVAGREP
jgi:cytochrome c biogenesis protein